MIGADPCILALRYYTRGHMDARRLLYFFLLYFLSSHLFAADLLLKNVDVYDGSGGAPFAADVRIRGNRIATVAKHLDPAPGEVVRDEHGLALAPGFIDMHSTATVDF